MSFIIDRPRTRIDQQRDPDLEQLAQEYRALLRGSRTPTSAASLAGVTVSSVASVSVGMTVIVAQKRKPTFNEGEHRQKVVSRTTRGMTVSALPSSRTVPD